MLKALESIRDILVETLKGEDLEPEEIKRPSKRRTLAEDEYDEEEQPKPKVHAFKERNMPLENDMLNISIDDSQAVTRNERMKVIDVIEKIDKQIQFLVMKKRDLMQEYGIVDDGSSSIASDDGDLP